MKDLDEYIKGSEKFPLDANRWGYLPVSIQIFLNTDSKKIKDNLAKFSQFILIKKIFF